MASRTTSKRCRGLSHHPATRRDKAKQESRPKKYGTIAVTKCERADVDLQNIDLLDTNILEMLKCMVILLHRPSRPEYAITLPSFMEFLSEIIYKHCMEASSKLYRCEAKNYW